MFSFVGGWLRKIAVCRRAAYGKDSIQFFRGICKKRSKKVAEDRRR